MIHRIIYQSTPVRCFWEGEIDRLVQQARIYNFSQDITGVLFYSGQQFVQVIEGAPAAVTAIYQHISADPRHAAVVLLLEETTDARLFPRYSLGFSRVEAAALARLAGFLQPQRYAGLLPRSHQISDVIAGVLREFVAAQALDPPAADWR